jgi:hypothetical protein
VTTDDLQSQRREAAPFACRDCEYEATEPAPPTIYELRSIDGVPTSLGGVELVVRRGSRSWRTAQMHYFGSASTGEITHKKLLLTVAHRPPMGVGFEFQPPAHQWSCEDGDFEALATFLQGEVTGSFMLLPTDDPDSQNPSSDPAQAAALIGQLLRRKGAVEALTDHESAMDLLDALQNGRRVRELRSAISELQTMLTDGEASESAYQHWCEQHVWAFGNAYVLRDEVRDIGDGDSLDLLVKNAVAGYRDLIELKTPTPNVLLYDISHKSYYFSADVSKVLGQVHRYLDNLHRRVGMLGLTDHPELSVYHPRGTIVIGRSHDWDVRKSEALHGLNSRLNGITVMTYDHLVARAESVLAALEVQPPAVNNHAMSR